MMWSVLVGLAASNGLLLYSLFNCIKRKAPNSDAPKASTPVDTKPASSPNHDVNKPGTVCEGELKSSKRFVKSVAFLDRGVQSKFFVVDLND